MDSKRVIDLIAQIIEDLGFAVYTGAERRIDEEIKGFPAAWIAPLKLVKTSGILEGTKRYKGALKMMERDPQNAQQRVAAWSRLEEQWNSAAARMLEKSEVAELVSTKITGGESALTSNAEIYIAVEFDVETYFEMEQ